MDSTARRYSPGKRDAPGAPLALESGPHLLIDNHWIGASDALRRVVCRPERDPALPRPLVTGPEDGCFQPYLTVLRERGRFRLWYGHRTEDRNPGRSRLGYLESRDGLRWKRPARLLEDPGPITFGVSVLDRGADCPEPARRYVYGFWNEGGLKLATSPDGLRWTPWTSDVVLPHDHDINSLLRDDRRGRYVATLSTYTTGPTWRGRRRVTQQAFSDDLRRWSAPHFVLTPEDGLDEGETQFYAMDGFLARGPLILGMVKVLRDDLSADTPPDPPGAYGIGYTTLAWTRDGTTWTRDPEPFFDRDPRPGAWDHAHAWIDEQTPVGENVFLYYGGYARGHKVNRFEERQIGLARMRRDRYVAWEAADEGWMETPPLRWEGERLSLNVDARAGEVRAEVRDAAGKTLPGFTRDDCHPVTLDSLRAPLRWRQPLHNLRGQVLRLRLTLRNARLFALEVHG